MMHTLRLSAALAALAATAIAAPAQARIKCDQGFQVIRGQPLSTPYCEDEYLAVVAREYGVRVTGAAIRANYGLKRDTCRLVGRDIRVSQACVDENSRSRGRF